MRQSIRSLLIVALLLGAWRAAAAQETAATMKPVVVVSVAGYDAVRGHLDAIGKLSGKPQMVGGFENMLAMMTNGKALAGVDKTKPWGLLVQTDGKTFPIFAFVPVMVMVGGLQILTSRGNPEQHGTGMKTLSGAVIGALIGLGAFLVIVTFLWGLGLWTGSSFTITDSNGTALSTSWPNITCDVGQ